MRARIMRVRIMQRLKRSILIFTGCLLLAAGLGLAWPTAQAGGRTSDMPLKGGKFPHVQAGKDGLKGHRELDCAACHQIETVSPYTVTGKPSPNLNTGVTSPFPGHASCVSCHNFALMSFTKPAFCGICHAANPQSPQQPGLFKEFQTEPQASDFGVAFSHPAHRQPLPTGLNILPGNRRSAVLAQADLRLGKSPLCTDCHAPAAGAVTQEPRYQAETGHPVCFTCHQQVPSARGARSQKPFPVFGDCQGCHVLTETGAQRERAPHLFQTAKVANFLHFEHELDTRSVKKSEARMVKPPDALCAECHRSVEQAATLSAIRAPAVSSCLACHNEKRQPGLPEPLGLAVRRTLRDSE